MFSFFEKKIFLVDHLHGLVDIHNHILPGIDDGAKTVKESMDLIIGFSEFGIKNFVCTPHVMSHYYPNTPSTIKSAYDLVKQELSTRKIEDIQLDYSAEYMIDENFEVLLDKDKTIPIAKNFLLIEMSYLQPSLYFDDAIQKIAQKSIYPILAHPERYAYFHSDNQIYPSLKSRGIHFQLNMLSLSGYYGEQIQKTARNLLGKGYYEYVSSDAHNLKHLKEIKEIKIQKRTLDLLLPIIENTILKFY
ncbi:tyrosine-protein phosphatase [Flagellimonas sp.]|uniref:tyrosine-protein phosphatase n=1 Tax=Flagellimonas sp. TaxID=2058762 RepID=UPI003F4A2801